MRSTRCRSDGSAVSQGVEVVQRTKRLIDDECRPAQPIRLVRRRVVGIKVDPLALDAHEHVEQVLDDERLLQVQRHVRQALARLHDRRRIDRRVVDDDVRRRLVVLARGLVAEVELRELGPLALGEGTRGRAMRRRRRNPRIERRGGEAGRGEVGAGRRQGCVVSPVLPERRTHRDLCP